MPSDYEDAMARALDEDSAAQPQRDHYYDDLVSFGWPSIAWGIMLAGGAYPIVLGSAYFSLGLVVTVFNYGLQSVPAPHLIFMLVFGAAAFAVVTGLIGLVWSGYVSVVTLPLVHLVMCSMKVRTSIVWLGAFSGGLVAFLAVLPVTMQIPRLLDTGQSWGAVIMTIFGPGIATIVGQIGGARGGRFGAARIATNCATSKVRLLQLRYAMGWAPPNEADGENDKDTLAHHVPRFRFRTIHLLWIGVWASLLLTVIRLSGIPYELILPVLVGWLLYQAATLAAGGWIVFQFGPWWNGERQIRST